MYYKIASLILNGGQKNNSIADIFIAQPDTAKEALVGKLFIMAEIESQKSDGAKVLDFLINNINHNYYQNEKVILRERIDTISVESIFESALSKTNKDLLEFLTREKIKVTPFSFNLTVGIVYKNELYITNLGKNKNLLIYKDKTPAKNTKVREDKTDKIEYRVTDIGKISEDDNQAITINKLFAEVLSGKIPPGGYFMASNEALSEYISSKQLTEIVTRLSPAGASEQIRNLLEKVNSYASFFGILIKNTSVTGLSDDELKKQLESEMKHWDEKPEIVSTEEKTEAILNPAGAINMRRLGSAIGKTIKDKLPKTNNEKSSSKKEKGFFLKDKILFKKRVSLLSFKKIFSLFAKIVDIVKKISTKKKNEEVIEMEGGKTENKKHPFFNKKIASAILVIAILLIAGTSINTYFTKKRQEKDKILADFNSLISEINRNQNKIESSLIYGNENEARELWNKDKELLGLISDEEKNNRDDIKQLVTKQAEQLEKLRKITTVSSPEKIADFANLDQEASPDNLILAKEKLLAASANEKTIYQIDLKENIVTAARNLGDVGEMISPTFSDDGIFYLDGNSVVIIGNDGSFKKLPINQAPEKIGGIAIYGQRLYLIDQNGGQILRYNKGENDFNSPEKWLNSSADLTKAISIFIDGNIYIMNKDGSAEKYLKGKKESFSINQVDSPITNASKISVGQEHVFVFEPSEKRVIVFDIQGVFRGQYIFSGLNNVIDFAADDSKGLIYALSGQAIYQTSFSK
jgi:hypothetical protein